MLNLFRFFVFFLLCCLTLNSFAGVSDQQKIPNSYFRDNYGMDNNFSSFKAYGLWSFIKTKEKGFSAIPADSSGKPILSDTKDNKALFQYGYGAGMSFTTFFNEHIGVEMGMSGIVYNIDKDQLGNIQYNYTNKDNPDPSKPALPSGTKAGDTISSNSVVYSIPVHASVQFCLASEGGIRPYIGAGYHMNYVYSPFKEFDLDFMHGFVGQAGIDFVGKDDTIYFIQVKKYFVTDAKINYKTGFIYKAFSTETDFSPLIISAGIGFKF
jgi:outer membrane protein